MIVELTCRTCKVTKHRDDFPVERSRKTGRGNNCLECNRARVSAYRRARRVLIERLTAEVARLTALNASMVTKEHVELVHAARCVACDEDGNRAETAERERDEARKEIEALVWNLAGCGTIAESGRPQKFNRDMARPALASVNDMAAKLQTAERELAALRAAVRYLDDRGAIDVQDETVWVRDGDDMQPAPPEHAEALRKAAT